MAEIRDKVGFDAPMQSADFRLKRIAIVHFHSGARPRSDLRGAKQDRLANSYIVQVPDLGTTLGQIQGCVIAGQPMSWRKIARHGRPSCTLSVGRVEQ